MNDTPGISDLGGLFTSLYPLPPASSGEGDTHADIVGVLTCDDRTRALMCGVEDPAFVASQWAEERFSAAQTAEWAAAHCFTPWAAAELRAAGITPEQAGTEVTHRGVTSTAGYWLANEDLDLEELGLSTRQPQAESYLTWTLALRADRLIEVLAAYGLARALTQTHPQVQIWWENGRPRITAAPGGPERWAPWLHHAWRPTPVVSPWNGGSGFGVGWNQSGLKISRAGLPAHDIITTERHGPLGLFGQAIDVSRELAKRAHAEGWSKVEMIAATRDQLPAAARAWVDACVVLAPTPDGLQPRYAPLTGTGGNIGRADLSVIQAQHLVRVLSMEGDQSARNRAQSLRWLEAVFTGESVPLVPGTGAHLDASGLINPWLWVLAIEGICALAPTLELWFDRDRFPGRVIHPWQIAAADTLDDDVVVRGAVVVPLPSKPMTMEKISTLAQLRVPWTARKPAATPIQYAMRLGDEAVGLTATMFDFPIVNGQSSLARHVAVIPASR